MTTNNKKRGFTLAETLIVLSVIGVIAVLMLSNILKASPDKNKTLFKKAYSVTERTIAELVNDETFYPYDPNNIGFLNDEVVQIPGQPDVASGGEKLCKLFSLKLNILGETSYEDNTCKFETSDGIYWEMPLGIEDFQTTGIKVLTVDVDGKEKGPNRGTGDDELRDMFQINLYSDGRVNVSGEVELKYLRSHSIKKDEE